MQEVMNLLEIIDDFYDDFESDKVLPVDKILSLKIESQRIKTLIKNGKLTSTQ